MVRDTEDGKIDYSLIFDGPMLTRWADHLTKGAKKYAPRNWMKATGEAEYERFKRSFLRHLVQYLEGDRDEDHAAAMIFNINGMEYVREKLDAKSFFFLGKRMTFLPCSELRKYVVHDSFVTSNGFVYDAERDGYVRA